MTDSNPLTWETVLLAMTRWTGFSVTTQLGQRQMAAINLHQRGTSPDHRRRPTEPRSLAPALVASSSFPSAVRCWGTSEGWGNSFALHCLLTQSPAEQLKLCCSLKAYGIWWALTWGSNLASNLKPPKYSHCINASLGPLPAKAAGVSLSC